MGTHPLCLDLLAQDILERHSIGSEFRDALAQLLHGHLVLVEVEAELGLVVDVALLLQVERAGLLGDELLGDVVVGVVQLFQEVGLLKSCVRNGLPGVRANRTQLTAMVR